MKSCLGAVLFCLAAPCWAQGAALAPADAGTAAQVPQRGGEPAVLRIVTEDDSVRVEELRVRGQVRRIVVRPKLPGAPAYELGTAIEGRDAAPDRRPEGRALWQLFSF